jgi:glycosyltransferase involved in cell wall biosynthesis
MTIDTAEPKNSSQKIKIVHLLPHFENDGNGVVNAATDLAHAQSTSGHAVACVASRDGSLAKLLQDNLVATYLVTDFSIKLLGIFLGLPRLFRILRKLRPQVVHAHSIPTALMAKLLQPILRFRLVTSIHNMSGLKNVWLGLGDQVICVSDAVGQSMKQLCFPASKIRIIRNGPLDSPRRPNRRTDEPLQVALNKPAIITVAALQTHKGIADLITAFALARKSIPDLSVYILGDGPEREALQSQASRFDCRDHIHFVGFVRDPRPYLAQADIFVLPSHREAFGMALAEAREAGCAVIGTTVGGIPEVLEGGRAGIIVPVSNPAEMAKVLIELLANPILLRSWRKRASANLSWLRVERVSNETISVYAELLSSSAEPSLSWSRTGARSDRKGGNATDLQEGGRRIFRAQTTKSPI